MPPGPSESSNKPRRTAFAAKAARKHTPSDSSDNRSAAASSGQCDGESSDTDVPQRPSDRGARRNPTQSSTYAAKRGGAKKTVTFEVQDDSDDDDDTTVRAGPPRRLVHQDLPAPLPLLPQLPTVDRVQTGNNKKARKTREPALHLEDSRNRPVKTARNHGSDFRRIKLKHWGTRAARKRPDEGGRRYERMSVGPAGQRGPPPSSGGSGQDRRRRWFLRGGHIGSLRRRAHHRESESERHDKGLRAPTEQRGVKTVRNAQYGVKSGLRPRGPWYEVDMEDEPDFGDPAQDSDIILDEPVDEYAADTSEHEEEEAPEFTKPSQTLLDGLERLSLGVVRLHKMQRLPFLRRNLQRGFQFHCRMVGVDTKSHPLPRISISIIYKLPHADAAPGKPAEVRPATARSLMKDWLCPLCDLHKRFDNAKMLDKHLAWDHSNVEVHWENHYTISLTIPDSAPKSGSVITRQVLIREQSTSNLSSGSGRVEGRSKSIDSNQKSVVRSASTPSAVTSESGPGSVSTLPTSVETEDIKPKHDVAEDSDHTTQTRCSSLVSRRSTPQATGVHDGLGPSAVPPYLPEMDERGDVYYSCRPGGPRLFDLLNPLPLKPFGVLKWVVIDREEELFELDDVLDEDKVMQALWFRWVFLNRDTGTGDEAIAATVCRNRFVADYFDGTKAFVKENWELIKEGAGLLALRTWLLVLVVNNFLLPTEVVKLMQYYQELANIRLRY